MDSQEESYFPMLPLEGFAADAFNEDEVKQAEGIFVFKSPVAVRELSSPTPMDSIEVEPEPLREQPYPAVFDKYIYKSAKWAFRFFLNAWVFSKKYDLRNPDYYREVEGRALTERYIMCACESLALCCQYDAESFHCFYVFPDGAVVDENLLCVSPDHSDCEEEEESDDSDSSPTWNEDEVITL